MPYESIKFYKLFRERIVELFEAESPFENGEIELDESYFDGFRAYDGLVNYGFKKHFRVSHSDNEFALGRNHINGIENFWGLCKVRLSKLRGIHKHNFYLHIK